MLSRVRLATIAGGVVTALGVLAVLAFAGVLAERSRPARPSATVAGADAGPQTALQPELDWALLAEDDLTAASAPAAAGPARPGPHGSAETWLGDECTRLFEHLGALSGAVTRESTGSDGSSLVQALAVLPTVSDAAAVLRARRLGANCRPFAAALGDGTHVVVETAPATLGALPLPLADLEVFVIHLRVTAPGKALEGYLTLIRVGRVVSVLRQLGPSGTVTAEVAGSTLRRALDKLTRVVA